MAVTLQQIAEAAGVSRGTVDRALNNRGRIRPEVEERIKRIAREMGYQPSRAGRALAMAKRKIRIGVILQYMETPFMQQVLKGVSVTIPLQSYFRLNAPGAGQFEHTLIIVDEGAYLHFIEGCSAPKYNVANLHAGCVELFVGKNATLRYSTIENWSKNMYNLNTKRAKVEEGGKIEWVSGSFGSHVSYLYPMSILNGEGASAEFTGITFAGKGQNLDTGTKVVHNAPNTSSYVNTKSISKDGGVSTFRSSVVVNSKAKHSKSAVSCQSLMLDDISRSDTIPAMDIRTKDANIGHEARIGRISDEAVFYLMSRGISEEDARAMIVSGFADEVSKELPLEYAMEMNNLIRLEMKGSIG